MLAPYAALKPGPAPSETSLAIDYDTSPPHFQLFHSLRTGDRTLAVLITAILLSNVLSVALAGLFSVGVTKLNTTIELANYAAPMINGSFTVPTQEMYFILERELSSDLAAPAWSTADYCLLAVEHDDPTVKTYQVPTLGIGINVGCTIVNASDITLICDDLPGIDAVCRNRRSRITNVRISVDDPCWEGEHLMSKSDTIETGMAVAWGGSGFNELQPSRCLGTFFPQWIERLEPQSGTVGRLDLQIIKCTAADTVVELTADIEETGRVISVSSIRPLSKLEMAPLYPFNQTGSLTPSFLSAIYAGRWTQQQSFATSQTIRWLNYFMALPEPNVLRNSTDHPYLPHPAYVAKAFEDVYRRLFAVNLRLYVDDIILPRKTLSGGISSPAVVSVERVEVSRLMFYLSVSLLAYMILTMILLFGRRGHIGYLPKNLVGMYAPLYASNAKEECQSLSGRSPKERAKSLE